MTAVHGSYVYTEIEQIRTEKVIDLTGIAHQVDQVTLVGSFAKLFEISFKAPEGHHILWAELTFDQKFEDLSNKPNILKQEIQPLEEVSAMGTTHRLVVMTDGVDPTGWKFNIRVKTVKTDKRVS